MSGPGVSPQARERYLSALADGDRGAALEVAGAEVERGVPVASVLLDLVCAAQAEVGERWKLGAWNVAREHAAAAVSDAVVGALTIGLSPRLDKGHVVVACVEGEWHALPARVVAEILRLSGWRTTYLGASVPSAHLAQYLHDTGPDAVALSCSVATSLPRARRMIEALREAGVPVLVGGRGFGPDSLRARRLAATAWAGTAEDGARALLDLPGFASPPPPVASSLLDEHRVLQLHHETLVGGALERLARGFPAMASYGEEQLARTREDLGHIVDFLSAALYVEDDRIFPEFVEWLVAVVGARGVPAQAVVAGLDAVAEALEDLERDRVGDLPAARRLLDWGRGLAGGPSRAG